MPPPECFLGPLDRRGVKVLRIRLIVQAIGLDLKRLLSSKFCKGPYTLDGQLMDWKGAKVGGVGGAKQGLHPIFGMWGTSAMIRITRTRPQVLQRRKQKIAGSAANRGVCMTSLARPPGRGVEELDAVFDGLRQVSLLRSSEPLWSHAGRNLGRWLSPASGDEV
ncbi:hypothetical protein MUK42_24948 [Musa troglodytarum]|uniref:Uncharacterized protein n=1 Tax=Musa troglodytarum TaxID=320322 RepID=A0A9E7L668_9LILI|nr:hypothetical protein MUK42_24948 [Musa troglodytarum]